MQLDIKYIEVEISFRLPRVSMGHLIVARQHGNLSDSKASLVSDFGATYFISALELLRDGAGIFLQIALILRIDC
ncbi:hypothetical protein SUGI_1092920 [Cryptomeria japonica]|nr:hypothetical protein SUGI_1092920 [Cryptomeria japonica]